MLFANANRAVGVPRCVFFGERRALRYDRPVDGEIRIIPYQTSITSRCIIVIYFVGYLRVRFERTTRVSKSARNEKLIAIPCRQSLRAPAAECRRIAS